MLYCLHFRRKVAGMYSTLGARCRLLIGIFLGMKIPISRPILGVPRGRNPQRKQRISISPKFGAVIRRRELPFRPHLHAHIPRMTFVSTGKLPQIITIIIVIVIVIVIVVIIIITITVTMTVTNY